MFHPLVEAWFRRKFGGATAAQERAWPAIAKGRDALITAPTGSGKTLAAFLYCLDRLVRLAQDDALVDATHVVYVSPLKALSNDVQKNLAAPIAEMQALAIELGMKPPMIRASVRTGDTPASERQRDAKKPPHIWVTTPESLYILLTSKSGRRALATANTIILDEIHAIAGDKRGAHLALSVERLEDLVVREGRTRPQRVGLSATVSPIEVAARLLVGSDAAMPEIVDVGQRRDLDLLVEVPKDELGAVCTNEQWEELYDRLASLAREHKSTLIFVNTRRLVERVSMHLASRIGEEAVAAHHGSMSRQRRLLAEQRLKSGDLRAVIATASLELGIDVGAIDLTCVVGSPRAIGTALQRIGRSGHFLGATPKGRFFPLTRDQLLECAAIVKGARSGVMDRVALRDAPLDVLTQQIIATCAAEDRDEDELFALVKRAAPYASLVRKDFDDVVKMASEGVATRKARTGALLHRDEVNKTLKGRRGARIAALTSGGAIPDNANYDVLLLPEATKVGTLEEDFAVESMAGDVFVLGNNSWRIKRVEMGKVWVEDAKGAAPSIPFWLGEAPARTKELSRVLGELRRSVASSIDRDEDPIDALVRDCALDRAGAELAKSYIGAGLASLGAVPSEDQIVVERFFDDSGGMQLVVHAPFGGRINRALGLALRKSFCRSFDFELQAAATDDGVLLSLGPQHSFPLESLFELLRPDGLRECLEQAALQAPMFGTRWRWNATRSLALLRMERGKRVPPPLQRMRSDDLLAAVFPAQVGCQDNHGTGPIEAPDHPLVRETMRDCLTEVMDLEGLKALVERIRSGAINVVYRESVEPSVFSHEILNANPYAYLDDAPLEERRSRAVSLRRGLPASISERIGGLDRETIARVVEEAQPRLRDADELHDHLLDAIAVPLLRCDEGMIAALVDAKRAARFSVGETVLLVAAERRSYAVAIWPGGVFSPELVAPEGSKGALAIERELALVEVVRARMSASAPTSARELAASILVDEIDVEAALLRLELDGAVLRGRFSAGLEQGVVEWCDRRLLARVHRRTIAGLREAIEPASPQDLVRFLLSWQGVTGARPRGAHGLGRVVEQLQGFEIAAEAWERDVLPARVEGYRPELLDSLCLAGEVVWGRIAPRDAASAPSRAAPITLAMRRDLEWLALAYDARAEVAEPEDEIARAVLDVLKHRGASFFDEIVAASRRARNEIEDALWELVSSGRITADGFANLRALFASRRRDADKSSRFGRYRAIAAPVVAGRWALLRPPPLDEPKDSERLADLVARQYLRRWGVLTRELVVREPHSPPWRDLLRALRTLEMRGEIRGGRFVESLVGEQFALPEAVDALRAIRREPKKGAVVELSSCDPLNLVGVLLPGDRIAPQLGQTIKLRDGEPIFDAAIAATA